MPQDPYELSWAEVLLEFGRACAKAGLSSSGRAIDLASGLSTISTHPVYSEDVQFWEGVVLARLEGEKPPFRPGDKVKGNLDRPVPPINPCDSLPKHTLPSDRTMEVDRVFYKGPGKWELTFYSIRWQERPYYRAENFSLVTPPVSLSSER